jgi:hypothetical protein
MDSPGRLQVERGQEPHRRATARRMPADLDVFPKPFHQGDRARLRNRAVRRNTGYRRATGVVE